jgi:hypothetical protein
MSKNKIWKIVKIQDTMGKTNFFFDTLAFNPWAVLAMQLQIGAPKQYKINELITFFEQKFITGSYRVVIWSAWYFRKACETHSSLIQKKNWNKIKFLLTRCPINKQPIYGLKEF